MKVSNLPISSHLPAMRPGHYYYLLFILFFSTVSTKVFAQLTSTINCLFPKSWEGRQAMVVVKPVDQTAIIDTTTILNRTASFTISADEPSPAYIWIEGNKDDFYFFIDSPRIDISFTADASGQPLVTGSTCSDLWANQLRIVNQIREAHTDLRMNMSAALQSGDSLAAFQLEQATDSMQRADNDLIAKMILDRPSLASSWYLFASNSFSYAQTVELFGNLSAFSLYPSYQKIAEKLLRKQLGRKAADFSLPTSSGTTFTLSKLKNNYILIDFSSRYLFPCQKRQIDLKKLYSIYHPLGLEIVTVSVEFDKSQGVEAIKRNRLPWIQVLDLLGSSTVMEQFAVEQMPDNILLDATKTMIGRDMSISELDSRLSQLVKK